MFLVFLIWLITPTFVISQSDTSSSNLPIDQNITIIPASVLPVDDENKECSPTTRTNTCNSFEQFSNTDLQTRSCMCDEKCSIYNDCCPDAEYENQNKSEFSCSSTFFDGNIYIKETCKPSWSIEKISAYCIKGNLTKNMGDIFLQIPVISTISNITYKNLFCALCNDEKTFKFWHVAVQPKINSSTSDSNNKILLREKNFWQNFRDGLVKDFDVHAALPEQLHAPIRYCSCVDKNDVASCTRCKPLNDTVRANFPIEYVNVENIPFVRICRMIPPDNSASRNLCQRSDTSDNEESQSTELTYIDECFYETIDGQLCLINSFFESDQFNLMDDDTIFVYKYNSNFSGSEWAFQTNTSIYLCGTTIPQTPKERWFSEVNSILSSILIAISLVFLILHLIMYATTRKMRYPLGRIIACYSATLFVTFTLFESTDWLSSCEIVAALLHYFFLSCFAWLVVASYECWRTVTASTRVRNTEQENSLKRFLAYCLMGWIFPLAITSVAIYFELSPTQSIACNLKPGYGRLNQCFIAQLLPSRYFFQYPSGIMFLFNILFFLRVTIHVLCNMSSHRNLSIFAKLALVTGIPWTIGLLVTFTNALIIRLIYSILNSSQGIFIFFAFAYDKEIIKNKLNQIVGFCTKKTNSNAGNNKVTFTNTAITKHGSQSTINEYF